MTTPKHILMTADTVGGVWTYAIELARGLTECGIRVSAATMGAPLTEAQRRAADFPGFEVFESSYKLEWMEDPWADVDAAGEWLLSLERELQPDLIHLNGYAHGNLNWSAPVVVVAHSCVYSWWNAVHGTEPPSQWREYQRRVSAGLHGADLVVGVSRSMLKEIEHWYGKPSAGYVIYNGHQTSRYRAAGKRPFVLSTGRIWDAAKNLSVVDFAAPLMRWPVFVAGQTEHPEGGCRQLTNVNTLGMLDGEEIQRMFAQASIYASPALYEPFGLSILEAALSECALVLGDIPSLREIWGDAALYVRAGDSEALALAVNALSARPEIREAFGLRARKRASTFTRTRMVQSYLSIYPNGRGRYGLGMGESPCAS